jgi:hypothetical protein
MEGECMTVRAVLAKSRDARETARQLRVDIAQDDNQRNEILKLLTPGYLLSVAVDNTRDFCDWQQFSQWPQSSQW